MNFPAPPIDRFPHAVLERPYVRAKTVWPFQDASGFLLDDKTDGSGQRWYPFEIQWVDGSWRAATITPGDPSRSLYRHGRELTGFSVSVRKDLQRRAKLVAEALRAEGLKQHQWLLDLPAQPVDAVSRKTGLPPSEPQKYSVADGWLIIRRDTVWGLKASARRMVGDGTSSLIVKP